MGVEALQYTCNSQQAAITSSNLLTSTEGIPTTVAVAAILVPPFAAAAWGPPPPWVVSMCFNMELGRLLYPFEIEFTLFAHSLTPAH